jgi:cytoskeletal protein CcmA (bactofilin family)
VCFTSGIRIDGCVKGNVVARAVEGQSRALLVLSDKGRIEGTVTCGDAVVNGTVVGDLVVEHFLELQSNSRVDGTIRYEHLQMDVGAAVRGQLIRADAQVVADNVVALGTDKASGTDRR